MLHPTIQELTNGEYNRYELALATAKCARLITDEYVRQHDSAEKGVTGKDAVNRELRDEKAVHVAVKRLKNGEYSIERDVTAISDDAEEEEILDTEAADETVVTEEVPAQDAE